MAPETPSRNVRRTHVSHRSAPIALRAVNPLDNGQAGAYKPNGFWYEVNGDWRAWCRDNEWGTDKLVHLYSVDLADCRVLMVDSLEKLDAFHERYRVVILPSCFRDAHGIDWGAVASEWDGVEIAPYQWPRRLEPGYSWYYGWDCASGVIWNPRGATVTRSRRLVVRREPARV